MWKVKPTMFFVTLILTITLFVASAHTKPTPAEFYSQNKLIIIVATVTGNRTDLGARIFAKHWAKMVKGGIAVVRNIPEGGGIKGTNDVWTAKPDGLTITVMTNTRDIVGPTLGRNPAMKYRADKFSWIGSYGFSPHSLLVGAKQPYESIKDLQAAKGLKLGSPGIANLTSWSAALMIDALKLDCKIIAGFKGPGELALALGRKEIHLEAQSTTNRHIALGIAKKPLVIINPERIEQYPDVPTLPEIANLTTEQKEYFDIICAMRTGSKVVAATPGIPEDRLKFLRDIFDKMHQDPGYLDDMKKHWIVWTTPIKGEDMNRILMKPLMEAIPKAEGFRKLVKKYTVTM